MEVGALPVGDGVVRLLRRRWRCCAPDGLGGPDLDSLVPGARERLFFSGAEAKAREAGALEQREEAEFSGGG